MLMMTKRKREKDYCQKMQIKEGLMSGEKYLELLEKQSLVSEQGLMVTYNKKYLNWLKLKI